MNDLAKAQPFVDQVTKKRHIWVYTFIAETSIVEDSAVEYPAMRLKALTKDLTPRSIDNFHLNVAPVLHTHAFAFTCTCCLYAY